MKPLPPSDFDALTEADRHELEARAARVRQRSSRADEHALEWFARFPVGDAPFGLPLERLEAAVPLRLVTPVPLAPSDVVGIVRFRGEVVTVFSLASLLGVRGWRSDPSVLLVARRADGRRIAFDCERVPTPVALPSAMVAAARASAAGAIAEYSPTTDDAIALVDLDRLLDARSPETRRAG